jgi:serine/threonine protein kinase
LSNANVVRIYDQGFTDEHIFITMEYLPGGSLDERITRGISTQAAARYTKALANGLAGVHAQGVVHRDLKPRNILFRNTDTPVITDFGVAKDLQNPLNETQAGEIFGTPYYLSPEQARSENQFVESSADIYSLGVMFYELLTGQRPFTADRLEALLKMHMVNDPPPMIGPARSFEHIIAQMMAKSPTNRPTALQVAMEIDEVLERM